MSTDTFGTGEQGDDAFRDVNELTYEEARDELVETVKILELGQMGLDESLKYWERGEALAKTCERHLDGAARRVEQTLADNAAGEGSTSSQPSQGDSEQEV